MSKMKFGGILILIGLAVAFSPLLLAFATTAPGHNWMSEGDSQSGGTYIWGMLITLPVGGIIGLVGLIKIINASVSAKGAGVTSTKGYSRTLGIILIVLGAGFAMLWLPVIFSVFGAALFLAGAFVVYSGIRLLLKSRDQR